jgi:hypothetical protein
VATGYVYVLVNSAMPGLVKVGKTSRSASERVDELSGATGVPAPFVLAFEQLFEDCALAEDFVHAELERRGLRPANNREFFRASPSEVVKVILQAPGLADGPGEATDTDDDNADLLSPDPPEDEWQLEAPLPRKPWEDIFEEADANYYGTGDTIQDYEEALELYKQAARLGSTLAYERIGGMYYLGEGVKEDERMAFKFYKEGAKKGNYYCCMEMAKIFRSHEQTENARKAWNAFFDKRRKTINEEIEEYLMKFITACISYIDDNIYCGQTIENCDVLRTIGMELFKYFDGRVDPELPEAPQRRTVSARNWVCDNLLEGADLPRREPADPSKCLPLDPDYPYWKPAERRNVSPSTVNDLPAGSEARLAAVPVAAPSQDKPRRRWWQAIGWP